MVERAQAFGAQPALAVGLHVVGEDRVGEHRDMPEHVVEDVRLLDIVEAVGGPDEIARRKAPVGEMLEEDVVGHQARHRDDLPAGDRLEVGGQRLEIGDPIGELQLLQPCQEFVACPARQHTHHAAIERAPRLVLGGREMAPLLRDRPVVAHRRVGAPYISEIEARHRRPLRNVRHDRTPPAPSPTSPADTQHHPSSS